MSTDVFAKVGSYDNHAIRNELESLNRFPYFRVMQSPPTPVAVFDGERRINLGSSNYLGLSGDPRICAAAQQATERYGTSLNGSRFMNGTTPLHLDLEADVAQWLGEEDALVFPSGYSTNLGVISALVGRDDVALCDAGDHASILDGAALASGRMLAFRHNRLDRLESLLSRTGRQGGALVVVDSVYSMQGDVSDIVGLACLARRHRARLLVDEAHAVGVLGPDGQGLAALAGLADAVDLRMGTFSKALAGGGGFVAGPADVIDFLRIHARAFMFTAASPPAGLGAARAALRVVRSAEGEERRERLAANARYLRACLTELGLPMPTTPVLTDGTEVQTPILRIPVDDDQLAIQLWNTIYDAGVYVNVALHPAVPRGMAQLRLSVQAEHTRQHLDAVAQAFAVAYGHAERTATDRELTPLGHLPAR